MFKPFNKFIFSLSALILSNTVSASLITNGSFEQLTFADNSTATGIVRNIDLAKFSSRMKAWDVYTELPGWTTSYGSGIELQKRVVVAAQDGSNHVELDSHPRGSSNSIMTQSINNLTIDDDYLLAFFYKPRTKRNADNGINVLWHESSVDLTNSDAMKKEIELSVNGTSTNTPNWVQHSIILNATAELMNISFGAFGKQNTLGGFIDNVSLLHVENTTLARTASVPEPSSIALFLLAITGIAFRSTKRSR